MSDARTRLMAEIDGVSLPEEEARALWKEFSEHMDANRGDVVGFATAKGWERVAPEHREGKAVLIVQTGAASRARAAKASPATAGAKASAKKR